MTRQRWPISRVPESVESLFPLKNHLANLCIQFQIASHALFARELLIRAKERSHLFFEFVALCFGHAPLWFIALRVALIRSTSHAWLASRLIIPTTCETP